MTQCLEAALSLTVDLIRITRQLQVAKPLGCCPSDAWSDVVAEGLDEGVEGTAVGDLGEGSNSPSSSSVILRVEAIQNLWAASDPMPPGR